MEHQLHPERSVQARQHTLAQALPRLLRMVSPSRLCFVCFLFAFNRGSTARFDSFRGGVGGSLIAWNPELEIGVAYTMCGLIKDSPFGFKDPRCIPLFEKTMDILALKK